MFTKYRISMTSFILALLMIFSCSGRETEQKKISYISLKDIPDQTREKLSKKSFFFGHQSVGYNIIDGVQEIMKEYPKIKFHIVESTDASAIVPGTIVHSKVGKNSQPRTKIDDFSKFIGEGIGKKADAVALKFCYVDIKSNSDPEALFSEYEKEIEKIRKSYPDLAIIHITVPLTTLQSGPKAWIKKIIGRQISGVKENINRYQYNELLLNKYQAQDPILDIAQIESTNPDGTRSTFVVDGKTYYSLVPEYTTDGGHLNEIGKNKVAEQLILLLANME